MNTEASTTTKAGARVSPTNDLCDICHRRAATSALYWTDDAEFDFDPAWTYEERFLMLQRSLTDARADCRANCGRVVS